jgi:hypothetical protein
MVSCIESDRRLLHPPHPIRLISGGDRRGEAHRVEIEHGDFSGVAAGDEGTLGIGRTEDAFKLPPPIVGPTALLPMCSLQPMVMYGSSLSGEPE